MHSITRQQSCSNSDKLVPLMSFKCHSHINKIQVLALRDVQYWGGTQILDPTFMAFFVHCVTEVNLTSVDSYGNKCLTW